MHIIDHASRFIRVLTKKGLFAASPLKIVEIGLRTDPASYWAQFGASAHIHRFEADAAIASALGKKAKEYSVLFSSHALAIPYVEAFHSALAGGTVDFVQADMRAGGLEMLRELGEHIEKREILGFNLGFAFDPLEGGPALSDIEHYLRQYGYRLYDLDLMRSSFEEMHYPVASDHRDGLGNPIFGPTIRGPLSHGRALFFKDITSDEFLSDYMNNRHVPQILKLAALFTLFNLTDCAAKTLIDYRHIVAPVFPVDDLLDLLVPDYFGAGLSYHEYKEAYIRQTGRPSAGRTGARPFWKKKTG